MSKVQEKFVIIKRKLGKDVKANSALKTMNDLSVKYMGAEGYRGTALPITGLSPQEIQAILPNLVQLPAHHNEFPLAVNNYYHELRENIPAGKGLKLDVTTEKQTVFIGEKGIEIDMPRNPLHYILYRRAITKEYRQVANTPAEAKASGDEVKFFVHDLADAKKAEVDYSDERDKAYDAFLTLKEQPERWADMLVVYGINPEVLSTVDQKLKLGELARAELIKDREEQLAAFKKFYEYVNDEKVSAKATLAKYVTAKLISTSNGAYIYNDGATSINIGSDEMAAIAWLEDENNSQHTLMLAAQLNTKKK